MYFEDSLVGTCHDTPYIVLEILCQIQRTAHPEQNDDIDSLLGSLDDTDLGGGYDGLGEGNFNSHDAILRALSDQRVTGSELFDINLAREEAGLNALTPEDILRIEPGLKSVVSEESYFNNVPTPDIEVEDVDVEGGGEDEDEQLKNRREVEERLAQAEAGDAGDEDKSESNFDFTGQIMNVIQVCCWRMSPRIFRPISFR